MSDPPPASGFSSTALAAIFAAALAGLSGVVLGAYAAHGAPPDRSEGLSAAALYALIHGLVLIAAALIHDRAIGSGAARWLLRIAMLAFALGIALFSGGIFLQAGTAPIGGVLLIAGWLVLALGAGALSFPMGKG